MAVWSEIKYSTLSNNIRIEAEYYQEHYLEVESKMKQLCADKVTRYVKKITDGTHFTPKYTDDGVKFYSALNVKENLFEVTDKYKYISNKEHQVLFRRCNPESGDILIRKVGVGPRWSCVIPEMSEEFSIFVSLALLKVNKTLISPYYLSTFINSRYGQNQLLRIQKGASQPDLHLEDIAQLKVPRFSCENEIDKLTISGISKAELSKNLYTQAQQLLEDELGLRNYVLEKSKSCESSFSEIVATNRIDADYYQTHFRQQQGHLSGIQTKPLRQIVNFTKGIEVGTNSYTDSGKLFVRVSNIKENGIVTTNSDKYIDQKTYDKLQDYKPAIGEILLTKDGTLGVCYVLDTDIEGIISGGIMKMSIKDKSIPAEYLSLVINSSICRFQIEQTCSGALILHWKPRDIAALKIPILSDVVMNMLSDLVVKAKEAQKESVQLLEQAKRGVEELIEGGTGA